jgi:hypothetical protein
MDDQQTTVTTHLIEDAMEALGSEKPVDALQLITGLSHYLDRLRDELVTEARDGGASWQEIADALGVSRQAAWQRYERG